MSGAQWDRTIPPNDEELIRAWIAHDRANLHTATVARVQSYDAATQTADLVPLVRNAVELPDGTTEHENLPVLPCVPVLFPRTAGHFIAFALAPGDMGLVVFCESAVGHWRAGDGDVTDPGDLTRHSLSHGVFLPGLFHRGGKLAHAPAGTGAGGAVETVDPVIVSGSDATDGVRLAVCAGGALKVTHGTDTVAQYDPATRRWIFGDKGLAQFVALANLVNARLETIRAAFNAHTHVVTGTANLTTGAVAGTGTAPASAIASLDSVAAEDLKTT